MTGAAEVHNPLIPSVYDLAWTLVTVFALVAIVVVIVLVVVRSRRSPDATRPTQERLAELEDLHRQGVISDDEHRAARTDALRAAPGRDDSGPS